MKVMIISDLFKRENIFKCNWCMDSFTCYLDKPSLRSRVIFSLITKPIGLHFRMETLFEN